jgi:uncharacterized integral membrane protein (TIGR00698 family)
MNRPATAREFLPGLAVLAAVAVLSHVAGGAVPGLSPLVVAVAAGVALGNTVGTPERFAPGIESHKLLLETGIVLLGAGLSLSAVARAGPLVLALVLAVVAAGLLTVTALSRLAGVSGRTGSLLAAGASICGVSAVVAAAGAVDAEESEVAYAAATVLLFDALTLVAFPLAGAWLGLGERAFGLWAGLSMFSTGPVTAAGISYGAVAGRWATLTKLTRNAFIGVVVAAYSVVYATGESEGSAGGRLRQLYDAVPRFLVGFLLLAAVANAGVLSSASLAWLGRVGDWLFLLAFAGLGFDLRLARMRAAGVTPIAVVGVYLLAVSAATYLAVTALV